MPPTHIAIVAKNPPNLYSGGRYHSWTMAEALASAGHRVTYVTNHIPLFYEDFNTFPHHAEVRLHLTQTFTSCLPGEAVDVVILVPGLDRSADFYSKTLRLVHEKGARLIFQNFETPNWFNALAPVPRDPSLWDHWKLCAEQADMVLSIAREGDRYAREFYDVDPARTRFTYSYPSVNTFVADSVADVRREKRIVVLSRFVQGEHKGAEHLLDVVSPLMRGYTLVLLVGSGDVPPRWLSALTSAAKRFGVDVEVKRKLTDHEKFSELKRASIMVYPSLFEGFGLPPVEALYCGLPCVAFDLPVLREVSGDALVYAKHGDWAEFRARVEQVLGQSSPGRHASGCGIEATTFEAHTKRIDEVIQDVMAREPLASGSRRVGVPRRSAGPLRRWFGRRLAGRGSS